MKLAAAALLLLISSAAMAGEQYLVKVKGMSCPFCACGVEKQIMKLEGVAFVRTDLDKGAVAIEMKDGKVLPEALIRKAVTDAGFSVHTVERVTHLPGHHKHTDGQENEHP
ncbi:heavy-metal-associated domain-containing protein [Kordiimonas lacus]|uniref:Mercuric ion binding protein n=1 Tax=Kordiimonas lacus TaxID=637679 RepID=A0A1G6WJW2_9PROT|nr:heavy-metal-associated domain-containing protein [Kordiimonas lacus]SDD66118.1 mercuric ion binding protein [Kordiimonas lacus]